MPKKAIYSVSMMLFLSFVAFWGIYQMQPPEIIPITAPEDQFSAERAMVHLKKIAKTPHPIGSKENQKVRDYLFNQLKKLDLELG